MLSLKRFAPSNRWLRLLCVFATYVLAADLLPVALLLGIDCIGYLPYSDRPGPGWQHPHIPSWSAISFYFGFAMYTGVPTLFYAGAHTLLAYVYEVCSLPKWLVRVLGGVTAFLSAGLLMEGAGWMIAIAAAGVYLAALSGLLWGIFVLPSFVRSGLYKLPTSARILLPAVLCGSGLFVLIRPLLPNKPEPGINFELERITPSERSPNWAPSEFFKKETWSDLQHLHLSGDLHGGTQIGMPGTSPDSVDVVVIALEPIKREYKIAIPQSGHVIYLLRNGALESYPQDPKTDGRQFVIKPGVDDRYEGGQVKDPGWDKFNSFTWYPTIPKIELNR